MADSPTRITLSRTKGWRMPAETVKVDRSTKWGNPWIPGSPGRVRLGTMIGTLPDALDQAGAVAAFRFWIAEGGYPGPGLLAESLNTLGRSEARLYLWHSREIILRALPDLRGKSLACWCKPGCPCHADVLLDLANRVVS